MAIPDYQTLMLPVLKLASDGKEHKFSQSVEELADEFNLITEERSELLPSGSQAVLIIVWVGHALTSNRLVCSHHQNVGILPSHKRYRAACKKSEQSRCISS